MGLEVLLSIGRVAVRNVSSYPSEAGDETINWWFLNLQKSAFISFPQMGTVLDKSFLTPVLFPRPRRDILEGGDLPSLHKCIVFFCCLLQFLIMYLILAFS